MHSKSVIEVMGTLAGFFGDEGMKMAKQIKFNGLTTFDAASYLFRFLTSISGVIAPGQKNYGSDW